MTETNEPSIGYAWYVVFVLMICYTLSFIDRQILSLLVGPIKHDLGISDTSIGLLQGLAFAFFYTLLGLPMGRIADRYSRRNLIAVGVFFWSVMTAVCSLAQSFWTLFLARMGVGVGEATLGPSAFSLIADYFPRERLGTALSVYAMGIFFGAGMALIVGGTVVSAVTTTPTVTLPLIGTLASWRLTFLIVGIPGILFALLVYTIREPQRKSLLRTNDGKVSHLSIGEVMSQMLLRWRSVVGVCLGLAMQAMCNYAQQAWLPTYFIRVHGWTPSRIGFYMGIIVLITGCAGMLLGGRLCDYWQGKKVHEAPLKVGVLSTISAGVFFSVAMSFQNPVWNLIGLIPAMFFLAMPVGSAYAALQLIFPNQLRGQVSALMLFTLNIGGLILGPFLVGVFNDYLFKNPNMVGYSVALAVAIGSILSAVMFRATYSPYRANYAEMHKVT